MLPTFYAQRDYYQYILKKSLTRLGRCNCRLQNEIRTGSRTREVQRETGTEKRGMSLHGFLVIAQVSKTEKRTEVIDLWSEDTKTGCLIQPKCNGHWIPLNGKGIPKLPGEQFYMIIRVDIPESFL